MMKKEKAICGKINIAVKYLGVIFLMASLLLGFTSQVTAVGTLYGTQIKNKAQATYKDNQGNSYLTESNEVITTVARVVAVEVTPPTSFKAGIADPNQPVSYGITITNTGNAADTFDLTTVNTRPWPTTLYFDENGDGIYDPLVDTQVVTNTGLLQPDATYKIILVVKIPATASLNQENDATVTARSRADTSVSASGVYTAKVLEVVITVNKKIVPPLTDKKPGDIVTYAICGSNNGNTPAYHVTITDRIDPDKLTFQEDSVKKGPLDGDYEHAISVTDPSITFFDPITSTFTFIWGTAPECPDPNCSGCIYFQVAIKDDLMVGTSVSDYGNVRYNEDPNDVEPYYELVTSPIAFAVAAVPDIHLNPDQSSTKTPGEQTVYPIQICNSGNGVDTVALTSEHDPNAVSHFEWEYYMDVNGNGIYDPSVDYKLTDTDFDSKIDTGPIQPSAFTTSPPYCLTPIQILAITTIPAGTPDGAIDTDTLTGSSTIDPNISSFIVLRTTVSAPALILNKVVEVEIDPNTSLPYPPIPGKKLTYTITLQNLGTGKASSIIVADNIPTYTTYVPGTLYTGYSLSTLVSRTDPVDGDNGQFTSTGNQVEFGKGIGTLGVIPDLPKNQSYVVRFTVQIN